MTASAQPPGNPLRLPIESVRGVRSAFIPLFHRLGLHHYQDLLFDFPRDYLDMSHLQTIADFRAGEQATVLGQIDFYQQAFTRRGPMLTLTVRVGDDLLSAVWFGQPWLLERLAKSQWLVLTGKPRWNKKKGTWEMVHPKPLFLEEDVTPRTEEPLTQMSQLPVAEPILPIYSLTEGLPLWQVRRAVREVLASAADAVPEVFPNDFLREKKLLPISEAIRAIHFPPDTDSLANSRRRFVYQELLILQLALAIRRQQHQVNCKAPVLECTAKIDGRIRAILPFTPTAEQNRAIGEIAADLGKPVPMNRLLQGDVGSGKTLVAVYAMLQAVAHGHQAVFMAPTEILARQHLRTLTEILSRSRVQIAPLFGGQRPAEREQILSGIASGQAQIIIGTQAIVCGGPSFHKLGLVIIDEQHKFGVLQRSVLKSQESFDPHYLVMTATPIPRSVTMTLFGDLDVSTIRERPPGRSTITTSVAKESQRERWWQFFRRKLTEGRQGYVVVPRVEDQEQEELRSVGEVCEKLTGSVLAGFSIAAIHGRMSPDEKERIMTDFRDRRIQVLVATSVIEVGIDVPNATLMTIENAERFGLAQLHQLRGRIGRGRYPGFCCVFGTVKAEEPELVRERLEIFANCSDGFELAEKDLILRGPGDLFGTQQHGLPPFRIADLARDRETVEEARNDAAALVGADPGLTSSAHQGLRRQVLSRYGHYMKLGDVG